MSLERVRTHHWPDPLGVADVATTVPGIEFIEMVVRGDVVPPICTTMEFRFVEAGDGLAVATCTPQEFHFNPIGSVHGGLAATLLDSVTGSAVHTKLPAGTGYTTLSLTINYLRGMSAETGEVRAIGTATSVGRRVGTAEGVLLDSDERKLATATATCLIVSVGA